MSSATEMVPARSALMVVLVALSGCGSLEPATSGAEQDSAAILRTVLEDRLSIEESIPLDRRLLPADTLGFLPPFSAEHDLVPESPLLAAIAAVLEGVTLAPLRRVTTDSGWVLSMSHPVLLGDSAIVYWASSHFDPGVTNGVGYWAAFFRSELVRTGERWRIVRTGSVGSEN